MSKVVRREDAELESQLQVYLEPSSCKTKEEDMDEFCERNPQVPIRFYEISVTATDYGGNVGNSSAIVVVVPKMKLDEDVPSKEFQRNGLYNENYIEYIIGKDSNRYILESTSIKWDI